MSMASVVLITVDYVYIYMLEVQASEENYSFSIYILGVYSIVVKNAC
jgi:hypothetical protein